MIPESPVRFEKKYFGERSWEWVFDANGILLGHITEEGFQSRTDRVTTLTPQVIKELYFRMTYGWKAPVEESPVESGFEGLEEPC